MCFFNETHPLNIVYTFFWVTLYDVKKLLYSQLHPYFLTNFDVLGVKNLFQIVDLYHVYSFPFSRARAAFKVRFVHKTPNLTFESIELYTKTAVDSNNNNFLLFTPQIIGNC